MAKKSLLELVQQGAVLCREISPSDVLVDDFGITFSELMRFCYEIMAVKYDIALHEQLLPLDALSDLTKPNYMKVPTAVKQVQWIKYNVEVAADAGRDVWNTLDYCEPDVFIERATRRNSNDANVMTVTDFGNTPLYIYTDKNPQYWTTFDDYYIIADSYNSAEDTTLQASKSQAYCLAEPVFTIDNNFVPILPDNLFPVLLADTVEMYYGSYLEDDMPSSIRRQLMNLRMHSQKQTTLTNPPPRKNKYGRR